MAPLTPAQTLQYFTLIADKTQPYAGPVPDVYDVINLIDIIYDNYCGDLSDLEDLFQRSFLGDFFEKTCNTTAMRVAIYMDTPLAGTADGDYNPNALASPPEPNHLRKI